MSKSVSDRACGRSLPGLRKKTSSSTASRAASLGWQFLLAGPCAAVSFFLTAGAFLRQRETAFCAYRLLSTDGIGQRIASFLCGRAICGHA
jgi:hypothetical protein